MDFSFRIGGVPRFYLETKRISEDLTKPQWVRQAMDYAWTKGVTWALLSDFEGLRVLNAEWKEDNPLRAQFIDFGVDTYLADFERLWWLSRTETVAGTLNREAEKVGKKAHRQPVSQHLFDDLKEWRHGLFKNVRAANPLWSPAQLDAAVLRMLNRLIFIRAAEDRQVEPPLLRPLLRELRDQKRVRDLWPELAKLFHQANETYDSQLFESGLIDNLKWDASSLEVLIEGLYGKQFLLYNFNAIDANVLGTAYEQYLGHIVASEASPAAEMVEKRAKRKSQGIFFTPTFVVKYIVGQTLGRYLDEHGDNPSQPVRVLDMACGSGSFLIEAFDVLDRHVAEMRGHLTIIIGNPPYVRQETLGEAFKAYVASRYTTHAGTADLYVYFIERAMQLLKPGGYFGFIVVNKWLRANYGQPLRRWLKGQHIVEIVDFGDLPVFQSATTYPCILILRKDAPAPTFRVTLVKWLDFANLADVVKMESYQATQAELDDAGWSLSPIATQAILEKMRARGVPLGEYMESRVFRGIITGLNEAFVINRSTRNRLIAEDAHSAEIIKPFVLGRDVKRYAPLQAERYLIFMPNGWTRRQCPEAGQEWEWLKQNYRAIANHLSPFQEAAEKRWDKGEFWWELRPCDYYAEFEKPKIVAPAIVNKATFSFDNGALYSNDKTSITCCLDGFYLLGILNAQTSGFFLRLTASTKQGGYFEQKPVYLAQIPIPRLDLNDPTDAARHDRIVALVDEMLALQREYAVAQRTFGDARESLARRIAAVDAAIDREVYALYGLTEEEIETVRASDAAQQVRHVAIHRSFGGGPDGEQNTQTAEDGGRRTSRFPRAEAEMRSLWQDDAADQDRVLRSVDLR